MIILKGCKSTFSQISSYTRRGKHRPPLQIKPGDTIAPFIIQHQQYYKDFDLTHTELVNHEIGTKLHQLECAEENNTCSIIFKSPSNSKPGLNYALEKLLQCGSKKYAVRNLPSQMSMRSFSQLTPSYTTDDYLIFSFNSPILKDFRNIFNVYCSMLFAPLLREEDFQDAVRRFTYQRDKLGYTGQLAEELFQSQFQLDQTVYSIINEELLGNPSQLCKPLDLAKITYQELSQHYKDIINLSNCTMIIHGDINLQYFIEEFNQNCKQFQPQSYKISNPTLAKKEEIFPKTVSFQHLKRQTIFILSFRIDNATQQQKTLLQILSFVLFDMPQSPFIKYNTPQTPYPSLYGFRQRYFNIGLSFFEPDYQQEKHMETVQTFKSRQKLFIEKQKEIMAYLKQIVDKKFDNKLIERCLIHLQNNFYEKRGMQIIESVIDKLLAGAKLDTALEVTQLISKLIKNYRKQNIFENLLKKFVLDNPNFIVMKGFNNSALIEEENSRNRSLLLQIQSSLPEQKLGEIRNYSPPSYLQDINSLPIVAPNQLQFFEDQSGEEESIKNIRTVYSPRHFGNKFTFKFDLTDLGQDDIPILALFCKAFPQMGYKAMKERAFVELLSSYIGHLQMTYETVRALDGQLKVQAYLTIEFTDRNHEYAFSVLNGLFTNFNNNNLTTLSRVIQHSATNCFHQVSENILHYHGIHLAASKSPFAFFESPIFQARTLCGVASDIKKVANPKMFLQSMGAKFEQIWSKMMGWSRIQLLWECHPEKRSFYRKYLQILISQIKNQGIPPREIDIKNFPTDKWLKYYPNYDHQISFEAFSVPYRTKDSASSLVLSSIINHNISNFNKIGGCFLFKGALISFIQGNRQKYLQLEEHYKRIEKLDVAKRKIFQHFNRFTVEDQFKKGVTFKQARYFKEAVISVQKSEVEEFLQSYLLKPIKEGSSSMLSLGPRLQNYEPLIKKGWEIQRSIDDVSLGMQSLSKLEIQFKLQKYIDIC